MEANHRRRLIGAAWWRSQVTGGIEVEMAFLVWDPGLHCNRAEVSRVPPTPVLGLASSRPSRGHTTKRGGDWLSLRPSPLATIRRCRLQVRRVVQHEDLEAGTLHPGRVVGSTRRDIKIGS